MMTSAENCPELERAASRRGSRLAA